MGQGRRVLWGGRAIAAFLALVLALSWYEVPHPVSTPAAAAPGRIMAYGILSNDFDAAARMGFTWVKAFASWKDIEPSRGQYAGSVLSSLSATVSSARSRGLSVLLNVSGSPAWASGSDSDTAPPINDDDFANFMAFLAGYLKGRVGAYEVWNEPNLRIEWGMQPPDPVKFAAMLRAAYPRMKAADPNALVITGGLSTAGDGVGYWGYGDLLYIKDMYVSGGVRGCPDGQGGQRSCFDALGSHPYGGPFSPETPPSEAQYTVGMYFRRAAQQKQMMDAWGKDYERGVWATEFNWFINPAAFGVSCSWGDPWPGYWLSGSASEQEATQADYLRRAFNYAYENWPWMQAMIVFNLDFQGGSGCDQVRWYSLTRSDGTRRPAYNSLSVMPKPGNPDTAYRTYVPLLFKDSRWQ